jgi:hypothetical protein
MTEDEYDNGLSDAWAAVKALTVPRIGQPLVLEWLVGPDDVLAAIDGLRQQR